MKQKWHVDELVEAWTLDEADLGLVRNKTGSCDLQVFVAQNAAF